MWESVFTFSKIDLKALSVPYIYMAVLLPVGALTFPTPCNLKIQGIHACQRRHAARLVCTWLSSSTELSKVVHSSDPVFRITARCFSLPLSLSICPSLFHTDTSTPPEGSCTVEYR